MIINIIKSQKCSAVVLFTSLCPSALAWSSSVSWLNVLFLKNLLKPFSGGRLYVAKIYWKPSFIFYLNVLFLFALLYLLFKWFYPDCHLADHIVCILFSCLILIVYICFILLYCINFFLNLYCPSFISIICLCIWLLLPLTFLVSVKHYVTL